MAGRHWDTNASVPSPFEMDNSTDGGDYTDSQRPPANYVAVVTGLIKHPLLFAFTSLPHFRTPLTVSPGCILQINKLFALLSLTQGLPLEPNPRQRGLKIFSIHESSLLAGETSHMHINQDAQPQKTSYRLILAITFQKRIRWTR